AYLASINLFIDTLTWTGATVYMHQCHRGSLVMLQENAENHHKTCPICIEHEHEQGASSSHSCNTEEDDCCKDIQIDLKKAQEEVETAPSSFNLMTLSPATLSILWLVVFQPPFDSQKRNSKPHPSFLAKLSTHNYLLHFNFRI